MSILPSFKMYARTLFGTCKKHWLAFLVAILASAYVVLPSILSYVAASESYDGVFYSNNSDWLYYASRIKKISDGHNGGNQYFFEHAQDINVNTPGAEIGLAFIVQVFHIDTIHLLMALNIIAPLLITLIFYALLYQLSRSRWVSVAIPLFLLMTNIWDLSKAIHPQINLPILLLLLYVWFKMLSRLEECTSPLATELKKMWKSILLCGTLLGLLYFIYLYDWSFFYVVLGCSALLSLIYRQRDIAILNGLILTASVPFGIGYLLLLRRVFQSPLLEDLGPRYGMYHTHLPESLPRMLVAIAAVLLIALFIRYAKLQKNRVAQGALCLIAGNLIYPNYQIILGVVYCTALHWSFMPIILFSIGAAFIYPYLKNPPPDTSRRVRIFGILFIILFVAASLRLSSFKPAPNIEVAIQDFKSVQRYGPVLRYLQTSTPSDSVVLTHDRLSYIIPAFTHNFIYYLNYSQYTPVSNRELVERYLLSNQFDPKFFEEERSGDGSRARQKNVLWQAPYHIEETLLFRLLYGVQESPYSLKKERAYVRDVLNDLESSGEINVDGLKKYRLDYIVWDKESFPDWTIDQVPEFKQVFESNNLIVYRVSSE